MKIVLIDNYDSFTYNLYQQVAGVLKKISDDNVLDIIRNDQLTLDEIKERNYDKYIISPGPGSPADPNYFGVCGDVITEIGQTKPVLGVCLGMQGIAHYFGGKVISAKAKLHGKTSRVAHDEKGLFANLPQEVEVMRYHSLVADPVNLPDSLLITAIALSQEWGDIDLDSINRNRENLKDVEIMGLRHKEYLVEGVQFHPESFGTEAGDVMIQNFLINT
jgi:anthranilate synthase/aminodeoxychorismate synthase-like glutamine amidotransferase